MENAVIHDIRQYNAVQFKKFMLPDDVIEDVYIHVDMEKNQAVSDLKYRTADCKENREQHDC